MPKRKAVNTEKVAENIVESTPEEDDDLQENGGNEAQAEAPAKRGRGRGKKAAPAAKHAPAPLAEVEEKGAEEPVKKPRGRQPKKTKEESAAAVEEQEEMQKQPQMKTRGRQPKTTKEESAAAVEEQEEKPKKGRGRAAKKPAANDNVEEEIAKPKAADRNKDGKQNNTTEDNNENETQNDKVKENVEVIKTKDGRKQEKPIDSGAVPKQRGRKKKETPQPSEGERNDDDNISEEEQFQEEDEEKVKNDTKKETQNVEVMKTKGGRKPKSDNSGAIPKQRGRKKKETPQPSVVSDEEQDQEGDEFKGKTKNITKREANKLDQKKVPKNATETNWESIDFNCTKENKKCQLPNFKITSWNVSGLRALCKKGGLKLLDYEKPDILCLQEIKCKDDQLPEELKNYPNYHSYWCSSEKDGYAGVGLLTKLMPIEVKYGIDNPEYDSEGRCITAEYEKFYLVNVYVPNAGRKLVTLPKRLEWNNLFKNYIKKLNERKPVIICGDMNVAHNEIDLSNPKTNTKNAGFTKEERDGMTEFLNEGFVDSFRVLYPDETGAYTFWSHMFGARGKNIGWRLDYFIVSKNFMENVCDNVIRKDVLGSDHCPLTLFIHN